MKTLLSFFIATLLLYNESYAAVYRGPVNGDSIVAVLFLAIIYGVIHLIVYLVKNHKGSVITEDIAIKYVYRQIESLSDYTSINLEGAKILGNSKLQVLGLRSIKKLDVNVATELSRFSGMWIDLSNLEYIDQETANALGRYHGRLDINNKYLKNMVDEAHDRYMLKVLSSYTDRGDNYYY